jgi:regulator of replication initiation timing
MEEKQMPTQKTSAPTRAELLDRIDELESQVEVYSTALEEANEKLETILDSAEPVYLEDEETGPDNQEAE